LHVADAREATVLSDDLEILTLAGTLSAGGTHLHMSVPDAVERLTSNAFRQAQRERNLVDIAK
jgi:predicted DNA-binding protein with PD1-like motif